MDTAMLCLANSKKLGGRCVAGIEVMVSDGWVEFVNVNGTPKWIRPVSATEHGEINHGFARHINVLDVIALNNVRPCPKKAQTENVYFNMGPFRVLCNAHPTPQGFETLCSNRSLIFGNTYTCVAENDLNKLDHSLVFIKAEDFSYHITKNIKGDDQLRGTFSHKSQQYDLPITDLNFLETAREKYLSWKKMNAYLTISLGEVFQGKSYKLIAAVIVQ